MSNVYCNSVVSGYDFVVNAVWPEVVANIEAKTPSIFAPGNPNVFHEVCSYRFALSVCDIKKLQPTESDMWLDICYMFYCAHIIQTDTHCCCSVRQRSSLLWVVMLSPSWRQQLDAATMLHTLAVLPALQLSAATYEKGAILFRGQGRNIYWAGDFYDVVISPTGDSVSARGDIWRGRIYCVTPAPPTKNCRILLGFKCDLSSCRCHVLLKSVLWSWPMCLCLFAEIHSECGICGAVWTALWHSGERQTATSSSELQCLHVQMESVCLLSDPVIYVFIFPRHMDHLQWINTVVWLMRIMMCGLTFARTIPSCTTAIDQSQSQLTAVLLRSQNGSHLVLLKGQSCQTCSHWLFWDDSVISCYYGCSFGCSLVHEATH